MKNGLSQIIVNIEAQKDEPTEYKILNRAIFYVSRLISSQKERDFVNTNYDDIKQVFSIWICMNMDYNSLSHIHLTKDEMLKPCNWKGNLDLLNIVLIGITNEIPEHDEKYEMHRLIGIEKGYKEADINMGCPFPLMTGKHKGSGILPYPAEVEALLKELVHYPELGFSVKMRLGWECADEWRPLLPLLNAAPLRRIVLHPRIGKQQYKGEVDLAAFTAFYEECAHPLVYNGDLLTVEDIRKVDEEFPRLEGVMLGRGLLANPALAWEYANGTVFSPDELHEKVKALHARLLQYYEAHLQGEAQLLSKMKPYWEYLLPDADRKIKKAIKKATTMDKYLTAVNQL